MSDYARLDVSMLVSKLVGFTPITQRTQGMSKSLTPTEKLFGELAAMVAGSTLTTSGFTSVSCLILHNTGLTSAGVAHSAYTTVTWRSAANAGTDNKVRISSGDIFVISDLTAANNVTFVSDTTDSQMVQYAVIGA